MSQLQQDFLEKHIFEQDITRFFSKKAKKIIYSEHISEIERFVKSRGYASENDNVITAILALLRDCQNDTEQNGEMIQLTLLVLIDMLKKANGSSTKFSSSWSGFIQEPFPPIQKMYQGEAQQHYFHLAIRRINAKIVRSDELRILLPDDITEEEFIEQITKNINLQYDKFFADLKAKKCHPQKPPILQKAFCRLLLSDYDIYPVLPALLALNALHQVMPNPEEKKVNKNLFQLPQREDIMQFSVGESTILFKKCNALAERLQTELEDGLSSLHFSASFPTQENENNYSFSRKQSFLIPICNTDKLAKDIALRYKLNWSTTLELLKELPYLLLDSKYGEQKVKNTYGKDVL